MVISNENKQYDIIDIYADGYTITIHQSCIHDYTYTANCLFDSQSPTDRRPVVDQSPTSCRTIATHFQSVGNQSPTSRRPVFDRSPTFRDSFADQSLIDLQPKKCSFDYTVVALVAAVFSRKAVADRLQYICDRGFTG